MGKFVDLTGRVFGRLTVLRRVENSKPTSSNRFGLPQYECQCSCPKRTILVVPAGALTTGHTQSCGCYKADRNSEVHIKDLTGMTFDRLTVLRKAEKRHPKDKVRWVCQCSCKDHNIVTVTGSDLTCGNTHSCGCYMRERTAEANIARTKWDSDEKIIMARYRAMMQRCYDKTCRTYKHYGARGIVVCDEWRKDPLAFVKWAKSNGFAPHLTIDRKNEGEYHEQQNGPYAPWNCRWVDTITQGNNRRDNVEVDIDGHRHTLAEWSRICGVPAYSLGRYLRRSYDLFCDVVLYNLSLKSKKEVDDE